MEIKERLWLRKQLRVLKLEAAGACVLKFWTSESETGIHREGIDPAGCAALAGRIDPQLLGQACQPARPHSRRTHTLEKHVNISTVSSLPKFLFKLQSEIWEILNLKFNFRVKYFNGKWETTWKVLMNREDNVEFLANSVIVKSWWNECEDCMRTSQADRDRRELLKRRPLLVIKLCYSSNATEQSTRPTLAIIKTSAAQLFNLQIVVSTINRTVCAMSRWRGAQIQ